MGTTVHTIALPKRPSSQVLTALELLQIFESREFPGVDTAEVVYWEAGMKTPDGRPAAEWEREGVLAIGVGGGWADPNALPLDERKGSSAAVLVARRFGVEDHPGLSNILKWTTYRDSQRGDFGKILGVMYEERGEDEAIGWFREGVRAWIEREARIATVDLAAFLARVRCEDFTDRFGESRRIISLLSDDRADTARARNPNIGNADVVIVQGSAGNILIAWRGPSATRAVVDHSRIVSAVRAEECALAGIPVRSLRDLECEGVDVDVPAWRYERDRRMLIADRRDGAPLSTIPLDRLHNIVRDALVMPSRITKRAANGE